MSHFTKLNQAAITNIEAFIAACRDLGFHGEVRRNVTIKDFYQNDLTVDVAVNAGQYDIALTKNKAGKFDLVADWWGLRRGDIAAKYHTDEQLSNAVLQHTIKNTLKAKYKMQGYTFKVTEKENRDLVVEMNRGY